MPTTITNRTPNIVFASNPVLALAEFFYWTRKLQARFFAGDYASAVEASRKAHQLLWTAASQVETGDFRFYAALAHAAAWNSASSEERQKHFAALNDHHRQLEIWALHCPANFETKTALVSAEIARIEGRMLDAEHFYEAAIRSAHDNGFAHCEAVSNECAAQFYSARGLTKIAHVYLRDARDCYLRWGADAKVRQLEEWYPKIKAEKTSSDTGTILASVEQLDLATVIRVSEAVSGEIEQEKLIDTLMRTAIEHAGAERGLLILVRDGEPRIEAEATAGPGRIEVAVRQAAVTPSDLPQSALHYVIRTQEGVLLDDASADNVYSKDEYVRRKRSRSVLCLPIVKQAKLVGALYLENNLTACAFTPDRVTVLQLLASQAAISLENATLYSDLQLQAGLLQRLPVSAWTLTPDGTPDFVNQVWLEYSGQTLDFVRSHPEAWMTAVHPEDREVSIQGLLGRRTLGTGFCVGNPLSPRSGRDLSLASPIKPWSCAMQKGKSSNSSVPRPTSTTRSVPKRRSAKARRKPGNFSTFRRCTSPNWGPTGRASTPIGRRWIITALLWRNGRTPICEQVLHPQDAEIVTNELPGKLQSGSPFEYEVRLKRKDGQYRWFHYRLSPMSDEQGRITRWYAAGTDIEELKLAEQRLQEENVALREEIDKASMFEEIVGTSAPLKKVLSRISKVAPTDSSVLITGETGTGKELVARAIHRRSRRSSHPFVSVNCAAIPRDLIASELFGHEKGAFTGATQRRLGRFELAEKGTIFLDEVGELPAETQIALLRVLQEREFERIGGTGSIRTDVRVIAATNRDLESAIESGKFRSDLFYRLNVFPIELPPLRKRSEDIPLLVTYFLNRYARKAGRHFTAIDKKSLDLLQVVPVAR